MKEGIGGPTIEDLNRAKKKMGVGILGTLIGLGFAAASFFGVFVPAHTEYKQLKHQLCLELTHQDGSKENLGCSSGVKMAKIDVPASFGMVSAFANIPNNGETAIRDLLIASSYNFHGVGTDGTAASETDTGCITELTTQYNPDNTRATGSQTNNGADVYRTVGTNSFDASATLVEFCLLNNATVGSGTVLSRIVFSSVSVTSGDSLQTTLDLTIA